MIVVLACRIYQSTAGLFFTSGCKFIPSCSEYTILSLKKFGAYKGLLMGITRIIKCNPFTAGKIDFPY
ncbi:MAG: membrane protein insertion efficiency factor YidD [Planctomycetes bacterium]|nr:membrane protein insertion efficiency factor YidD [Planctomycetota bacterium]